MTVTKILTFLPFVKISVRQMFLFLAINNAIFPLKKSWNVKIESLLSF